MHKYNLFMLASLFLSSVSANAADFVLDGGLHFGGETLAVVHNKKGHGQEVKAGQLVSAAVGFRFDISESFEIPLTVGVKIDMASGEKDTSNEVEVRFIRYPVNALLLYKADGWRIGGGLAYHVNPEYRVEGGSYNYTNEFENALGYLAELRFFFSDKAYVGGRYTNIEYELKNSLTGQKIDGRSIGIVLGANL